MDVDFQNAIKIKEALNKLKRTKGERAFENVLRDYIPKNLKAVPLNFAYELKNISIDKLKSDNYLIRDRGFQNDKDKSEWLKKNGYRKNFFKHVDILFKKLEDLHILDSKGGLKIESYSELILKFQNTSENEIDSSIVVALFYNSSSGLLQLGLLNIYCSRSLLINDGFLITFFNQDGSVKDAIVHKKKLQINQLSSGRYSVMIIIPGEKLKTVSISLNLIFDENKEITERGNITYITHSNDENSRSLTNTTVLTKVLGKYNELETKNAIENFKMLIGLNERDLQEILKDSKNETFAIICHTLIRKQTFIPPKESKIDNNFLKNSSKEIKRLSGFLSLKYAQHANPKPQLITSLLEILPTGKCYLTIPGNNNEEIKHSGYIRFYNKNFWCFLDYLTEADTYRMRFIFRKLDNHRFYGGTFSCESSIFDYTPTVGKCFIEKLSIINPQKEKILAKRDIEEIIRENSFGSKESEFFFSRVSGEVSSNAHTYYSDSRIWSDSEKYLLNSTARSLSSRLEGQRYSYFTYKQSENQEYNNKFIIEESHLDFLSSGQVELDSREGTYKGKLFYSNSVIKLSMQSQESGFLEIFIHSPNMIKDDNLFFGISLWRSSSRIQAKAIVLEKREWNGENEKTYQSKPIIPIVKDERIKEDSKNGVISYLRGSINRYIHLSHDDLKKVRPRTKEHREVFFYAAVTISMLENRNDPDLEKFKYFTTQAMHHGYACEFFAGHKIDFKELLELEQENPELKNQFSNIEEKFKYRIFEIAKEMEFLKEKYSSFNIEQQSFLKELWPWLNNYFPN